MVCNFDLGFDFVSFFLLISKDTIVTTRRVCFTVVLRMLVLRCGLFRFFAWISIVLGNAGRNGLAVGISMRYSDAGHSRVSQSSPGKVGPLRSDTANMMGENSTISCLILILTSRPVLHRFMLPSASLLLPAVMCTLGSRTLSPRRSIWHRLKRSVEKSWLGLESMLVRNTGLCLQEVRAHESCCSFESIGEDASLPCIVTFEAKW